ncbi:uncharacterized protein TRAVEDRAFT_49604 [Trametes versicolor FP-101664 SS1]|uniref:uncharacterized protein n=1 Tax=Trametes versicolor (strain FP-101664) TaxID=717944 RepID=UPI00046218C6|nr:uncharacterized protein TRAVEDRAFT_49604 [Trametes versicolor FP-101664 SS1]EIW56784.1 hypothetical protein TRAVEDRAFT_49604 [Trametes versicolor FP-101664 SS1]
MESPVGGTSLSEVVRTVNDSLEPATGPGVARRQVDAALIQSVLSGMTADPRTGRVSTATLVSRILHATIRPPTAIPTSKPTSTRPPQRAHKKMPVELWLLVFSHLGKEDLVNLASTCKHIGAIAEATFYRAMSVRSSLVITATTALSARHRADAVRSLTVSLDGVAGYANCAGVVLRLAGALSQLPSLRELAVTGAKLPEAAVRDILADCPSKQLEKFHCDSDVLVLASWSSLTNQRNLEDFRGVFDHVHAPPPHVTPAAFPKLRVLDAGAHFVSRIGRKSGVTHLSVRVSRATAPNVLARVTEDLGEQLVALRVVRMFRTPPRGDPFWGSDSPVVLCSALKAPVLKFFELRDKAPVNEGWNAAREALRSQPEFGHAFRTAQEARTPALWTVLWRPMWEGSAQLVKTVVRDYVLDAMALLPSVRNVGMPIIESVARVPGSRATEGWSVWEWLEDMEGGPAAPDWWEGDGTVKQLDLYASLEDTWATFP